MSSLALFLLLLSLSVSSCECRRIQPTKSNVEGIRKEFMHSIETTPARDDALNQAKKVDHVIQELISGFKALRIILCHGSSKGFNLNLKVMRSNSRHKLLGYESKLKESRTVEELVAMDYPGAQKGPSVHNR